MSRILFEAFDAVAVSATVGADITADFSAAVQLSESIPAVIAADITNDFAAAATLSSNLPTVTATVAADITADLTAAATAIAGVVFIPPEPGDPRVAVVTHAT